MTHPVSILAFSGSTRAESYNQKLVRIAAAAAESRGASVTLIRLADYPMPLYDAELEAESGLPPKAAAFKELMSAHQGLLIASPEYNSSLTAVLKNTIDWASRPAPGEGPLHCFRGKVVSLMSASPGALGGLRGLVHVRSIFANMGCIVLPDQVAVPAAGSAFADDGRLADEALQARVENLGTGLADTLQKLHHS